LDVNVNIEINIDKLFSFRLKYVKINGLLLELLKFNDI